MHNYRKKSFKDSNGGYSHKINSIRSDSGFSDTGIGPYSENVPLLERMLRFKTSDDEIFKCNSERDDDTDIVSTLEFSFSDEEEIAANQPLKYEELNKLLDDESNQFSNEYLDILDEIDTEKGPFSLPCSTCSLCSSCTTDTWDQLGITDDSFDTNPTPLDLEELEELDKLRNEHSELINILFSNNKTRKGDEITGKDRDYTDKLSKEQEKIEGVDVLLKVKAPFFKKEIKKQTRKESIENVLEFPDQLDSLSNGDDFFISPPDYDYFRDKRSHESRIEKDTIPWNIKEKSRNKCTKWLNMHHY